MLRLELHPTWLAAYTAVALNLPFQRVVATYSGSVREQDRVAQLLFSGRLDPSPLVSHHLPFSRAEEAVDLALRQQALKILLTPEEE